jgi:hypothetical protein
MTPTQSDDLTKALARDGAASVIESMLGDAAALAENAEDRVTVVMRLLEEMADHQVEAACCLMLSLWPVASELMMHDMCDGIDLWVAHNRSATVIEHLRHAAASEVDPDLKRHYEGFLHIEHEA